MTETAPVPSHVPVPTMPEHSFRNAQHATYAPPCNRNIGAPAKLITTKKPKAAYRNLPVIHNPSITTKVYNRTLETPVIITYHKLLSLSLWRFNHRYTKLCTSTKRIAKENAIPTTDTMMLEDITEEEMSYLFPDEEIATTETTTNVMLCDKKYHQINEGIIVEDDFDQYYRNLHLGEQPDLKRIFVVKESILCSIMPLVNNHLKVESILDADSQIIAMSEDICHELLLAYDPTVILNMQLVNGGIDPSLGLACNVPFLIGPLTFYLQVHVIH